MCQLLLCRTYIPTLVGIKRLTDCGGSFAIPAKIGRNAPDFKAVLQEYTIRLTWAVLPEKSPASKRGMMHTPCGERRFCRLCLARGVHTITRSSERKSWSDDIVMLVQTGWVWYNLLTIVIDRNVKEGMGWN